VTHIVIEMQAKFPALLPPHIAEPLVDTTEPDFRRAFEIGHDEEEDLEILIDMVFQVLVRLGTV
jgi:hypothetical protein